MEPKELRLVSEIGTNDYLPKELIEKHFSDVADWLWKKYDKDIRNYIRGQLSGMEAESRDRAPLHFNYIDQAGNEMPIDHSEDVSSIAKNTKLVQWLPHVIGGTAFRQVFGTHAAEILARPRYRNWKCIVERKPGYGIRAVGPDPDGVVRTWTITPTANYPASPPTVVSEPPYQNDVCWRDGVLHYTSYRNRKGSPWTHFAENSTNPLLGLLIELLQKYKLAV